MTRRLFQITLPLTTIAMWLAVCHVGYAAQGAKVSAPQKRRVAVRGHLTGARDIQQVVTWQTLNPKSSSLPYAQAHLAIEAIGTGSRTLWQTDGGQTQYLVDQVQAVDLDGDQVPEIVSLWWLGASGAVLRIFHWDRDKQSFVELQTRDGLGGVQRYRIARAQGRAAGSGRRIVVYARSNTGARRPSTVEYEVRGSEVARVSGGESVTTEGESGIEGLALIGPVRPGPIRQGQGPSEQPFKTTLIVSTAGERREVARLETGSDGRFRIALPPGEYLVGPPPAKARFLPRGSEELVSVLPGQFARVTINFDSGMR
jgi:hypothetical protein